MGKAPVFLFVETITVPVHSGRIFTRKFGTTASHVADTGQSHAGSGWCSVSVKGTYEGKWGRLAPAKNRKALVLEPLKVLPPLSPKWPQERSLLELKRYRHSVVVVPYGNKNPPFLCVSVSQHSSEPISPLKSQAWGKDYNLPIGQKGKKNWVTERNISLCPPSGVPRSHSPLTCYDASRT